jgi:hypothetical protein
MLAGLLVATAIMVPVVSKPQTLYALAGDTSSSGARLYADNLTIDGLDLGGGQVEGVDITRFSISDLESTLVFVIERDLRFSTVVPSAPDWTISLRAPTTNASSGIELLTSQACLEGIGVTRFNLFSGLLDDLINQSVRRGFQPSFFVSLINLILPLGLVDVKVGQFYAEVMRIDAPRLTAPAGISVRVTPKRVAPEFAGTCL